MSGLSRQSDHVDDDPEIPRISQSDHVDDDPPDDPPNLLYSSENELTSEKEDEEKGRVIRPHPHDLRER